jgi:RNA polymerase sigma-70 factor (ECF subfamily)
MIEDVSFLQRLKERDRQTLADLFSELNPYLLKVSRAQGLSAETAQDVIHATWEQFFVNLDKFEGRSTLRTFVCGILINKVRERRRTDARHSYEENMDRLMENHFTADGWWKSEPQDPQELLDCKETGRLINECLEGLTEQQKTAFVLREVDEENAETICHVLGVNVSHLRVLIFRAKEKLRQCLEGKIEMGLAR